MCDAGETLAKPDYARSDKDFSLAFAMIAVNPPGRWRKK
jgi:hypothetical protein